MLDYLFIGMAVAAVYFSTRSTTSLILKILFWLFVSIFSFSILLHEKYDGLEIFTLGSSLVLIFLHFLRLKMKTSKKVVPKAK